MAPLQPVGPYQPNPVTLVTRVKGDARRRDDPREGHGEAPEEAPPEAVAADATPAPTAAPPGSHPVRDPLDPDAPGHLLDIKA